MITNGGTMGHNGSVMEIGPQPNALDGWQWSVYHTDAVSGYIDNSVKLPETKIDFVNPDGDGDGWG